MADIFRRRFDYEIHTHPRGDRWIVGAGGDTSIGITGVSGTGGIGRSWLE
jgi:hypothetical protein